MRLIVSLPLLISLVSVVPAQDTETPRAFVERATKAIGGEDKLKELHAIHLEYESKAPAGLIKFKKTATSSGEVRTEMDIDGFDKYLSIVNRTKSYRQSGDARGMIEDTSKRELGVIRANWLTRILPLKETAYDLSWLKDDEIEKKPVKVILVRHAEMPEAKLFFDEKTALLVQLEFRTLLLEKEESLLRTRYSDYRDVNGILIAKNFRTTVDREGPWTESECRVIRWFSKVDGKWFAFPEK